MSVAELLAELRRLDAHLVLDGDRLRVNAPAGVVTSAHRQQLQQRKAEIIEFLRAAQQLASQQPAIVPLTATGTRVPIFAVAGHNGDVFCYRAIAGHLGPDQPYFGLQPPGLEVGTEPLTSVHALARYFATQIREFHPQGPYTIAGFCAGGTIGFELARQLQSAGAKVMNLILFGSPYATSYRKLPQAIATGRYLLGRSLVHARALLTMPAAERRQYFSDRIRALQPPTATPLDDAVLEHRQAVEDATMEAVRAYDPLPFAGHIDLMLPCAAWKRSVDAPLKWRSLAVSSAEFVGPDDCNGDTMLLPENAATFADFVNVAQKRQSR